MPTRAPPGRCWRARSSTRCRIKVGKELFTRAGPAIVTACGDAGFGVFLDLKFHDIPNTVAGACDAAADLGVWMVNVHAQGGPAMLAAARERLERRRQRPLLDRGDRAHQPGVRGSGCDRLPRITGGARVQLAGLAQSAGLDGVVCSPLEAAQLRARFGPEFRLVTPGCGP
jgi:orotidine-5'-phosphate decarboxylase